ncbi:hypothetical protein [Reyranella sp.]|uniref:hypothetical protein n=1 Tax=Reyranella sp. TaxID=1929291 RepID=UPI003BAB966B
MVAYVSAALVVLLTAGAVGIALGDRSSAPTPRWRLAALPALLAAATLVLLAVPPSCDLWDPQVWMLGLLAGLAGVARGAFVSLTVDHGQARIRLRRAPEAAWLAVVAALVVVADILATPVGMLSSAFVPTAELALVVLASFLIGRNFTMLVRSRDIPHHDL